MGIDLMMTCEDFGSVDHWVWTLIWGGPVFWLVLNPCPPATILEIALVYLLLVLGWKPFSWHGKLLNSPYHFVRSQIDSHICKMKSVLTSFNFTTILSPTCFGLFVSASVGKGFSTHNVAKKLFLYYGNDWCISCGTSTVYLICKLCKWGLTCRVWYPG